MDTYFPVYLERLYSMSTLELRVSDVVKLDRDRKMAVVGS
jgi:hypothetical protein